jgi:sulfatase modifying factor 1
MSPTRRQFLNGVARFSAVALLARQEPAFRGRTAGEERDIDGIRMCWCPAGRFTMGSPPSEAGRRSSEAQVQVTLSQGFWAGKYEVTQVQWRRVMKSFPDRQPSEQFGIGDDAPAYWISFEEAEAFAAEATRCASGRLAGHTAD